MTCPNIHDWDLLAMQALDESQAESMRVHAGSCASCRATCLEAQREHIERARMYDAFDREHERGRERLSAALRNEPALSRPLRPAADRTHLLRELRNRGVRLVKNHIAACVGGGLGIAAAVLLGAILFLPGTPRVNAATIFQNVRDATAKCRLVGISCRNLPTAREEDPENGDADLVVMRNLDDGPRSWFAVEYKTMIPDELNPDVWGSLPGVDDDGEKFGGGGGRRFSLDGGTQRILTAYCYPGRPDDEQDPLFLNLRLRQMAEAENWDAMLINIETLARQSTLTYNADGTVTLRASDFGGRGGEVFSLFSSGDLESDLASARNNSALSSLDWPDLFADAVFEVVYHPDGALPTVKILNVGPENGEVQIAFDEEVEKNEIFLEMIEEAQLGEADIVDPDGRWVRMSKGTLSGQRYTREHPEAYMNLPPSTLRLYLDKLNMADWPPALVAKARSFDPNADSLANAWARYVEEFIVHYELEPGQAQKARRILQDCQQQAKRIIQEVGAEVRQLDAERHEVFRAWGEETERDAEERRAKRRRGEELSPYYDAPGQDKGQRVGEIDKKRTELMGAVHDVFENQLLPRLRALLTPKQTEAAPMLGEGPTEQPATQPAAAIALDADVMSQWERYVESFIAHYRLDEAQIQSSRSILKNCQEQAKRVLERVQDAAKQLEELSEKVSDPKTRQYYVERRNKLAAPINQIFEKRLKPRLDGLLTRKQRALGPMPDAPRERTATTKPAPQKP